MPTVFDPGHIVFIFTAMSPTNHRMFMWIVTIFRQNCWLDPVALAAILVLMQEN